MIKPEQMRDAWDKFASGYDESVTPFSMHIAEDALQRVDIRPGMRFLDVAAGLKDIRVETANHGMEIQSPTQLWDMLTSAAPPIGALVDMLRQRSGSGPAVLNVQVRIGIGTK
jgi:hypothetical protein